MDKLLKVGDTVWGVYGDRNDTGVKELSIISILKGKFLNEGRIFYQTRDNGAGFYDSMLGKTVFLSKKEAEIKFMAMAPFLMQRK